MDFDLQWLLIAVPVVFALGWMASRLDLRQARRDDRAAPRAYFRGLNLLLTDQHDKAIDAFIEAVQHDPDTTELHYPFHSGAELLAQCETHGLSIAGLMFANEHAWRDGTAIRQNVASSPVGAPSIETSSAMGTACSVNSTNTAIAG